MGAVAAAVLALLVTLLPLPSWATAAGVSEQLQFLWHKGPVVDDIRGRTVANPFRGRTTPTGGVRCHERDDLASTTCAPMVASPDGPDTFPPDLDFFFDHPLNKNGVNVFPFVPQANATTGLIVPGFGGDYSGHVPCVVVGISKLPDDSPNCGELPLPENIEGDACTNLGILTNFESKMIGIIEPRGCIPKTSRNADEFTLGDPPGGWDTVSQMRFGHRNQRVIGGTRELPLRPAPDRGSRSRRTTPGTPQGLFLPAHPGIAEYARNIDPQTGRPRVAGATGPCTGLIEGATLNPDGTMNLTGVDPMAASYTSANFDPKDYASVSVAGIGRDPACLKPGGAAGHVNESGFGLGVDGAGDPVFHVMNGRGALVIDATGPDGGLFQNPLECDPASFVPPGGTGQGCQPARALNARRRQFLTPGIIPVAPGGLPGSAPENALAHHPASQQLFARLCEAALPPVDLLDPLGLGAIDHGGCYLTLFNATDAIVEIPTAPAASEFLVPVLAGEPQGADGAPNILRQLAGAMRQSTAILGPAEVGGLGMRLTVPLNRDPNDGVISVLNTAINRLDPTRPNPLGVAYFLPDAIDFLTLDSSWSNEQRALGGCGPFLGTRCDSAARTTNIQQGVSQFYNGIGTVEGGGIDLLFAEAGAMLGAMPGGPGTDVGDPAYAALAAFAPFLPGAAVYSAATLPSRQVIDTTMNGIPDTEVDCIATPASCTPGLDYTGTRSLADFAAGGLWPSTSALPQPGTVGFPGPAHCLRDDGAGGTVTLPGCRGALAIAGRDTAFATGQIEVTYDYNFDPDIDGCTFAPVLRPINPGTGMRQNINVTGVYPDGTPVDLTPCSSSTSRRSWTAVAGTLGQSVVNQTAGTLYQPHAACQANKWPDTPAGQAQAQADAVAGVLCDSRTSFAHFVATQADLTNGGGLTVITDFQLAPVATQGRDFDTQFFTNVATLSDGSPTYGAQVFRNEMAAFSWNLMQLLIATSCAEDVHDVAADPSCFDDRFPFAVGRCSFTTPGECKNVQLFLNLAIADDQDQDGVPDGIDNCLRVANPPMDGTQCDTDGDGYGNHCDPDYNNDLVVSIPDLTGYLLPQFGMDVPPGNPDVDNNCDGAIGIPDLTGTLLRFMNTPPGPTGFPEPGPSALSCAGNPPCLAP